MSNTREAAKINNGHTKNLYTIVWFLRLESLNNPETVTI